MDAAILDMGKRAAAAGAVGEVTDGMVVGLGTGSTAAFAIAALAARVTDGLSVRAVATSRATEVATRAAGITVLPLDGLARIDLCIDGVDEIDPACRAIKGAGGAMLVEKIVATMARRNIAIADASKAVARLGGRAVPVEVVPAAVAFVTAQIAALGGTGVLRAGFVTDLGNAVIDCRFAAIDDPAALAARLSEIPAVLGHGLFVTEINALYLGDATGVVRRERPIDMAP